MDNITFHLLVDHLKDVVFQLDEEGCWTYLNPAWEDITGFSIEDAIGSHFQGYVLPDDRKKVTALFRQLNTQKYPATQTEVRFFTKPGKIIWIDFSLKLIQENIIIGSLRDITTNIETEKRLRTINKKLVQGLQREQALTEEYQSINEKLLENEEELKEKIEKIPELNNKLIESEEKYRSVVIAMSEGIVVHAATGEITTCNKAAEEILGLSFAQMIGRTSFDPQWRMVHEDGSPFSGEIHPAMITLHTGLPQRNVVMGVYKPNGELTWISVNSQPIFTEGKKKIQAVVASFTDITIQKQAEQALRDSERRLRTLIANTPAVVYRCANDEEWTMEFISEEIHNISGYPADSFINNNVRSYKSIIDPHDQPIVRDVVDHAVEKNQPFQVEYRVRHRDNTTRWVLGRGQGILNEQGQVKFLDCIALDITEKKSIENAIRQHNDQLRKANLEMDNFVYRVSHDLRAPLSSSLGLIEVIRNESNRETAASYLQLMRDTLEKQDKFIRDILDYSRNARLDPQITTIDLKELIGEVMEQLNYFENKKEITKEVVIHQNIVFYSDRNRLKMILSNLISNAIRYANPKQPNPWIKIHVTSNNQHAIIKVEDNGIGIHRQHIDKIFDMFYRATDTKPGSGLGLYIVNEAVSKLNGHIKVESVIGEGARFMVDIPNWKEEKPVES